ncbi:hypothetical protein BN1708_017068, partial [Verticillium longisporum]
VDDVTRQINLIGQHIHEQGGIRVAIYLPNSIELIAALFACSFYSNLTAILIPFDVSDEELISMLRRSAADTVVTAPGAFPFDAVAKHDPSVSQDFINDYEQSLRNELNVQSEKYRFAELYGKLVNEWISAGKADSTSDSDTASN